MYPPKFPFVGNNHGNSICDYLAFSGYCKQEIKVQFQMADHSEIIKDTFLSFTPVIWATQGQSQKMSSAAGSELSFWLEMVDAGDGNRSVWNIRTIGALRSPRSLPSAVLSSRCLIGTPFPQMPPLKETMAHENLTLLKYFHSFKVIFCTNVKNS